MIKEKDLMNSKTLESILKKLKIYTWDIILIGDGSGMKWNDEAGWASVSIERSTGERLLWTGAMNRGSVNFAEIMAYLQPLSWFLAREQAKRDKGIKIKIFNIHILTDSNYCQIKGNSNQRVGIKNAALWSTFDIFKRNGLLLFWHWIPRATYNLNILCDKISREARLLIKDYNDLINKEIINSTNP